MGVRGRICGRFISRRSFFKRVEHVAGTATLLSVSGGFSVLRGVLWGYGFVIAEYGDAERLPVAEGAEQTQNLDGGEAGRRYRNVLRCSDIRQWLMAMWMRPHRWRGPTFGSWSSSAHADRGVYGAAVDEVGDPRLRENECWGDVFLE